jgi:lipopolysaccharide biosynthesis glycosyltransferase
MKYPVFFSVNDKFIPPFLVACNSLLKHSTKVKSINILYTDLTDSSKQRVKDLAAKYNVPVNFIEFGNTEVFKLKASMHLTTETYFRLFIQDYTDEDYALYLDSDIIILKDVDPLFDVFEHLGDHVAAAILDLKTDPEHRLNIAQAENQYHNGGVMVYNLKQLRKENFSDKVRELIKTPFVKLIKWADQDIINRLFVNRWITLDVKYNAPIFKYDENTVILHYAGGQKPWARDYKDKKTGELYQREAGEYAFMESESEYRKRSSVKKLKNIVLKWKKSLGL